MHLINADNRTNANSPVTSGPKSAHSLGYTGAGVNVAVFPDGMDPALPDFQRSGHSAVSDYRDFTGEGKGQTGGGEAFGDVSSLVAQGQTTYNLDQEIDPDFATTGGTCDVKVLGVAPGADVDVMKVFGATNVSFTSEILQGVDWAIQNDHADILSMSFGSTPVPNTAAGQPLTAILKNAMSDGVVVVASTGDSSPSNTEGSPALDPGVIGVAASTSYRLFAQTDVFLYDLAQLIHNGSGTQAYKLGQSTPGWLDNEVSTLSSSGVTEERRAPDIIAPGDLNWADCSTDTSTYTECENSLGGSTIGLEDFGGTSESTPLTAGVAALVIQAFRQSHGGRRRHRQSSGGSSSAVRPISASRPRTRAPACSTRCGPSSWRRRTESTRRAAACCIRPTTCGPRQARGVLPPHDQGHEHRRQQGEDHADAAHARQGSQPRQRQAEPVHVGQGDAGILRRSHHRQVLHRRVDSRAELQTFKVPKGVDLLDSRIGWDPLQDCASCTAGEPTAREILIDPKGRYAQYSDPQGDGSGFADERIHQPTQGRGRCSSSAGPPPTTRERSATRRRPRPCPTTSRLRSSRPRRSRRPGSQHRSPSGSGAANPVLNHTIIFHSNHGSNSAPSPSSRGEDPISTKKAGKFSGTLIGGNGGRGLAQELSYEFTVPKGVKGLDVN